MVRKEEKHVCTKNLQLIVKTAQVLLLLEP